MLRKAVLVSMLAATAFLAGCVERQMTLVTEPQGAKAYYNGEYVGQTPVTFHFTYYQPPRLRFEKDGYETLTAVPSVKPPLYERFPLDFLAETAPWTVYDRHTYKYPLKANEPVDVNGLVTRASELGAETTGEAPKAEPERNNSRPHGEKNEGQAHACPS